MASDNPKHLAWAEETAWEVIQQYDYLSKEQQETALKTVKEHPQFYGHRTRAYHIAHNVCTFMETKIKEREEHDLCQRQNAAENVSDTWDD